MHMAVRGILECFDFEKKIAVVVPPHGSRFSILSSKLFQLSQVEVQAK